MRKRVFGVLVAVALLAAGCGSSDDEGATPTSSPSASSRPVTVPVGVDAKADAFSATFFSYFPRTLTARPGDTIEFTSAFSGEPHTVAFGSVVDEALRSFDAVPDGTEPPADVEQQLARVPSFFSPTATAVDADPVPVAAQPCFIESGDPPAEAACPAAQQEQPAFNGRQTFYSSGFLPDEATFAVELADDLAPGAYRFMCLVDRTDMTGLLTVAALGQTVDSADEVRGRAKSQVDEVVARVAPSAQAAKALTAPEAAVAGVADSSIPRSAGELPAAVNAFPDEVTVPTGGSVTWTVNGAHTISFNAPEDSRPLYAIEDDGIVRANKKGFSPAGGPGQARDGAPPGITDGGRFDGAGFHSSGLVLGDGDASYRLTFARAGTYKYRCNFHTDMEGIIKVV